VWPLLSRTRLQPLFEPLMYPSRRRILTVGAATAIGHPVFYWVWTRLLPQPYEPAGLRMLATGLGLALLLPAIAGNPTRTVSRVACAALLWLTLPVFFFWMYLCTGGNAIWLAGTCAMLLIYHQVSDWRIAALGSVAGALAAWSLFQVVPPAPGLPAPLPGQADANAFMLGFSWTAALLLGLSSANPARDRINATVASIGIMAHELRTPLATMALIGDAIRVEAPQAPGTAAQKLGQLGGRLRGLVGNMHHQIDTQIANARLLRLPAHKETIAAGELVQQALDHYPFRSSRERECVVLQVRRDFAFRGARVLFCQVIDNIVKNGLRSLAAASNASKPGDLLIEIGTLNDHGRIVFTDRGIGIDTAVQPRVFDLFFTTDPGAGHGLGLAFCKRVVEDAHGNIRVKSETARGAIFTVELPLLR